MVKMKVTRRRNTIGRGQYFARSRVEGSVSAQRLTGRIVEDTKLSGTVVRHVLSSLSGQICKSLQKGEQVEIYKIGKLRNNFRTSAVDSEGDVESAGVRYGVCYKPDIIVVNALRTAKLDYEKKGD